MRVLVADDSTLFRRIIAAALAESPGIEIVGTAATGGMTVQKVRDLRPDVLTLDIEMPGMNGLEVLGQLTAENLAVNVILVSALTARGGSLTLQGLSKGAFDFITKPAAGSYDFNLQLLRAELVPRIRALEQRLRVRQILGQQQPTRRLREAPTSFAVRPLATTVPKAAKSKPKLIVIGVSTGGPNALRTLFSQLPGDLRVPVLVVQHMPPLFTNMLAENLAQVSQFAVKEAAHGEVIRENCAYIAPGGKHMRLVAGSEREKIVELTSDPPENNCRPAVDYLFRSVSRQFPGEALAVILTGMGSDGTLGLRLLKRDGCRVIAQDEATSVVFGMPKAAIDAGVVDTVLPISDIAQSIVSSVRGVPV